MLERLLERIFLSKYKYNFILKGGMLIAAMVRIDTRSTMDIDATIKELLLSGKTIKQIFSEIVSIEINDNVLMSIKSIEEIRNEADYFGFRISINTLFDGVKQNLKIDITLRHIKVFQLSQVNSLFLSFLLLNTQIVNILQTLYLYSRDYFCSFALIFFLRY